MNDWRERIGHGEERRDRIEAGLVARWAAMLDVEVSPEVVPQAIHWCVCVPDTPTSKLGPDGHPGRDITSFLPPVAQPRRMWASSSVDFVRPLRLGEDIRRRSVVTNIVEKTGASGTLVFVDATHETHGEDGLAIREVQTIVYRDPAKVSAQPPLAPSDSRLFTAFGWDTGRVLVPSETMLFRFSALTFNSHRIHYDLPYATGIEGYRGLVVQGPLTATLLIDLARREFGDQALTHFAFRGLSPAICGEALRLVLRRSDREVEFGAFAAEGRPIMSAMGTLSDRVALSR